MTLRNKRIPANRKRSGKSKVERFPFIRDPEKCLGYGTITEAICEQDPRSFASHVVYRFAVGDEVQISRAIITAAGPRYRVRTSLVWLTPEQIIVDPAVVEFALGHVDPNAQAQKWADLLASGSRCLTENSEITTNSALTENRFTSTSQGGNVENVGCIKKYISKKNITKTPNQASPSTFKQQNYNKTITMDKKIIRNLLSGLTPSETISINFIGPKAHMSGDYTVVKVKTGRGKGGSKLVELVNAFKQTLITGTPDSAEILNMTIAGEMHGFTSEADIPVAYDKSASQAAMLKETFKRLLDAEGDKEIEVESTIADFNGTFTVNKGMQLRGRGGQIMLDLENVDTGAKLQLWSFRHSGIVKSLTIVGDDYVAPETDSDSSDEEDMSSSDED